MLGLSKQSGDEFMRERMKKSGSLLVGLSVAVLLLAAMQAQAQLGVIPGISGPSFNLSTGTGHITTPDGDSLLIWGYGSGIAQYPGPTLIVNQGDTVTINLTNNLPKPTSIIFPGQGDDPTTPAIESVTASGGLCLPDVGGSDCLLTAEAAAGGGMVSYTFTATHAGTYLYHSGTDSELQIEMGLFGAIIVRPNGFDQAANRVAYAAPNTDYIAEYLFVLSEMDPDVHQKVEQGQYGQVDFTQYDPRLWFVNGRNAPDTLADPNIPWMPHQPYNAFPFIHPGERLLARFIGVSHHLHPWHTHGNNFNVIAQDGRLLTTTPDDQGATGAGPDLSANGNTLATAPIKTYDAIWDWTGKELGWDIYGHVDTDPLEPHEYAPDHGKPLPVILPEIQDMVFGGFWSGSPFLNAYGDLPPGEGGLNIGGGLYHIWHSHSEKELVNNDIFPGGMLTFCVVVPHGVMPFP
jgi:FtsP/CotA-like multicopper oxidase with cupredoxin domain